MHVPVRAHGWPPFPTVAACNYQPTVRSDSCRAQPLEWYGRGGAAARAVHGSRPHRWAAPDRPDDPRPSDLDVPGVRPARAGHRDTLSQRDLAERLRLEKSSVSRLASEMERKGWLVRERDPTNRRLYRLRLTDRGRALHAGMRGAFHDQYVRWVGEMTPAEREALVVGLTAFIRVLGDGPLPWDGAGTHDRGHDSDGT
ncbi:MarR family winged helix-turn-helix transcriptional regulator [Phytohabitans flavus]|uniref:MarR family winged helix-turn-helix transcriptional regulator n=1 Tax=Phytohabitans flavus TaxID=1076124 RepID=UPI00362952A1